MRTNVFQWCEDILRGPGSAKLGAGGGLKAFVGDLLNPISQKGNQDFPADAGRGWLFVELLPKIAKLTLRKVRQLRNLMGNVLSIVTRLQGTHSDACAGQTVKRNWETKNLHG